MTKRRVVVTGIGAVTPLASNVNSTWAKLINGESGLGNITIFDPKDCACTIAGEVKQTVEGQVNHPDLLDINKYIEAKEHSLGLEKYGLI